MGPKFLPKKASTPEPVSWSPLRWASLCCKQINQDRRSANLIAASAAAALSVIFALAQSPHFTGEINWGRKGTRPWPSDLLLEPFPGEPPGSSPERYEWTLAYKRFSILWPLQMFAVTPHTLTTPLIDHLRDKYQRSQCKGLFGELIHVKNFFLIFCPEGTYWNI